TIGENTFLPRISFRDRFREQPRACRPAPERVIPTGCEENKASAGEPPATAWRGPHETYGTYRTYGTDGGGSPVFSGSRTTKVVPLFSSLVKVIEPPSASTMLLQMASPRPQPPCSRER